MAWEAPSFMIPGLVASGDLSSKQFHFVKLSAANTVAACTAATDKPIGILQNKPTNGQNAEVMALGVSKLSSDAALSVGDSVGPSADGQGDAKTPGTDTTEFIGGQVIEATTTAGGLATVTVNCLNPHRAA